MRSRVGEIRVPLEPSDCMKRGVVSLPYGWGHDREGSRLSVASRHAGASMNDVADETLVDAISGTSVLDGIPVEVGTAELALPLKQCCPTEQCGPTDPGIERDHSNRPI